MRTFLYRKDFPSGRIFNADQVPDALHDGWVDDSVQRRRTGQGSRGSPSRRRETGQAEEGRPDHDGPSGT